jgi:hypothetical protein
VTEVTVRPASTVEIISMRKKLVLLVEDWEPRANEIKACVPRSIHLVWARTVGAAIGILRRDQFQAILLDYSLHGPESEEHMSGEDVAGGICETQARDCKILVHSHSPTGALRLHEMLKLAGYEVEHRPWNADAAPYVREWLETL